MHLDEYQEAIVKSNKPHILVVAGSGSGKTRVITERLKWLVKNGADPSKIVMITFTNFAADEMRERLSVECEKCFVGTIHSYANRLLITNGYDTSKAIKEEDFDKLFSLVKQHQEIIPEVDYLLVDEYQDIDNFQYQFFEMLNAKNTFYVGDDWQCIYEFRLASPQFFFNKIKDSKYSVYFLKNNYRSGRSIISFASRFMRSVDEKVDKVVSCCAPDSIVEETYEGLPYIINQIEKNGEYGKWFILSWSNASVDQARDALEKKGIPHDTFKKGTSSHIEIRDKMKENTVKVLTVHSAKGLESDYVGVFEVPIKNNDSSRRLAYVAATRAKERLIWCYQNSGNKRKKSQIVSWET